jgi:hypothetical protein
LTRDPLGLQKIAVFGGVHLPFWPNWTAFDKRIRRVGLVTTNAVRDRCQSRVLLRPACACALLAAIASASILILDAIGQHFGAFEVLARWLCLPGGLIAFGMVGDRNEFEIVMRVSVMVVNTSLGALVGALIGWLHSSRGSEYESRAASRNGVEIWHRPKLFARIRFRLTTVLIGIACVCIVLAIHANYARQRKEALDFIKGIGGSVTYGRDFVERRTNTTALG